MWDILMIDPSSRSKNQFVDADASSMEGGDSLSTGSEMVSEEGAVRRVPLVTSFAAVLGVALAERDKVVEITFRPLLSHAHLILAVDMVQC
jgi:hypothetical protein